jgi:hypothetical protein
VDLSRTPAATVGTRAQDWLERVTADKPMSELRAVWEMSFVIPARNFDSLWIPGCSAFPVTVLIIFGFLVGWLFWALFWWAFFFLECLVWFGKAIWRRWPRAQDSG